MGNSANRKVVTKLVRFLLNAMRKSLKKLDVSSTKLPLFLHG